MKNYKNYMFIKLDWRLDCGATSLYPSAMWDENSVTPKLENGFDFTPYLKDVYVESLKNQTLQKEYDGSAILKII